MAENDLNYFVNKTSGIIFYKATNGERLPVSSAIPLSNRGNSLFSPTDGSFRLLPQPLIDTLNIARLIGDTTCFLRFLLDDDNFGKLYFPVQHMLDITNKRHNHGFNNHEKIHIEFVAHRVFFLLQRLENFTSINPLEWALAAVLHDIGNMSDRSIHHLLARRILEIIFSEHPLFLEEPFFKKALEAIEIHDEKSAWPIFVEMYVNYKDCFFEKLKEKIGVVAFALLIADKTHIGAERAANTKGVPPPEAHAQDSHFYANLLCSGTTIAFEGRKALVTFNYDLENDNEALNRIGETQKLLRKNNNEIPIPPEIKTAFKEKNKTYFESWVELVKNIYKQRIAITVLSLFALYDDIDNVEIVFQEVEPKMRRLMVGGLQNKRIAFSRNNIDSLFETE